MRISAAPAQEPRKRGRPVVSEADKMVHISIRLTPAQKAKLQAVGTQRLRAWLDRL